MRRVVLFALLAVALTIVLDAGAGSRSEPLTVGADGVRVGIDHATAVAARGSIENPRSGLAILTAIVMLAALASLGATTTAHTRRIHVAPVRRGHSRAPPSF